MHRRLFAYGVACLLIGSAVHAHEIGTTRVTVLLAVSGDYDIEIVTDAVALLEKLDQVSGDVTEPAVDVPTLQKRLEQLEPTFRTRTAVAFDGQRDEPVISWRVVPANTTTESPLVIARLSGTVPDSATHVTWKYGWTFTSYRFVVRHDGTVEPMTQWLDGAATSDPVPIAAPHGASTAQLARQYVHLGFTHILPKGIDHVIFVLGLFLLNRRLRPILLQVSTFTIAHSLTLALALYGLVAVPASVVEPLIALSIAYIALENLFTSNLTPSRYVLVFAFGLLHGLGFAGALADVGMPRTNFMTALISFNIGVELGQLTVMAAAFLAVGYWFGEKTWFRRRISLPASACIMLLGIYWTAERLGVAF